MPKKSITKATIEMTDLTKKDWTLLRIRESMV